MKKYLALLLALAMIFTLCACGNQSTPAPSKDNGPAQNDPPAEAPGNSEPAEAPENSEPTEPEAPTVDWPTKNIRFIVGFAAGGDNDLFCRILADALGKKFGVNTVVEDIPGGSAVVGRTELLSNDPDGYTLMLDQYGSCISQILLGNTTYAMDEAGTQICALGKSAIAYCVRPDNDKGIKNMEDFINYAKEHPGELTVVTPGQVTFAHLASLNIFKSYGIEVTYVPANGTGEALTQVLGGHVDAITTPVPGVTQYIESGDLIYLGVSGESMYAPEAPLCSDYGDDIATWYTMYTLWGPAGMDEDLTAYIAKAVGEVMADPEVVAAIENITLEAEFSDVAEGNEITENYRGLIKDAMIAGGLITG